MKNMKTKDFILEELQKEYDIEGLENIDRLNFVEEGYITSLGIIQFVIALEEQFAIEFTEEELSSDDFKIVGKLVAMVERKIASKEEKAT